MIFKKASFGAALLAVGLAATWLLIYVTPNGIGLYYDSLEYVGVARSILAGRGFGIPACEALKPMTRYPPMYSLVLALTSLIGINVINAARLVSALCLGGTSVLCGLAIYRISDKKVLAIVGAILFATSTVALTAFSWAMSEPLYIFASLASLLVFSYYLETPIAKLLLIAGLLAGVAFLTRYIGVTVIATMILATLVNQKAGVRSRIRDSFLLAVMTGVPMAAWLIRNELVAGTATSRVFSVHPPDQASLVDLTKSVLSWFVPLQLLNRDIKWLAIGLAITAMSILVIWALLRRSQGKHFSEPDLNWMLIIGTGIYLVTLGLSITFFDAKTPLNDRILAPVYLSLLIIFISFVSVLWRTRSVIWRGLASLALIAFALVQVNNTFPTIQRLRSDGQGYARHKWRKSETAAALEKLNPSLVYTNDITAVYFIDDMQSCIIPTAGNAQGLAQLQDAVRNDRAALVIFGDLTGEFMPYDELTKSLTNPHKYHDGEIYYYP